MVTAYRLTRIQAQGLPEGVTLNGDTFETTLRRDASCVLTLCFVVLSAGAASPALAENWKIEPAVTVGETWTDNVRLLSAANAQSDLVTELSPAVVIRGEGARVRMDLDYHPSALLYARDSSRNGFLNALNAFGVVEAVEKLLFVEAHAQISQQAISAFGAQPTSNISDTENRTETRVVSVSPYVKGSFGSWATYDLRFVASATRTAENVGADGNAKNWSGRLASSTDFGNVGWILDYYNRHNDFRTGPDTRSQLGRGTLIYHADPTLWVFARGGRESNNYSQEDTAYTTHGMGLEWAPTGRTRVSAENDKRFFGRGYRYAFRHRTSQSAWSLVATKDDTTTTDQLTRSPVGNLFERFSELLTSQISDPVQRAEQVRQILTRTGIPRQSIPQVESLTSGVVLERRVEGSVAVMGARNTWTFSAYRSQTKQLTPLDGTITSDFAAVPETRASGLSLNWSHRLSGLSSLIGIASWQRNRGIGAGTLETVVRRFDVGANTRLSPNTTGSIGLRHVRFDGQGETGPDYRENAVFAALTYQF